MPSSFDALMPNQYWKFFTDVEQWDKNDPEVFDKEFSPGYFRCCSMALWWMLKTAEEHRPVDLDYIIALRNLSYHNDAKPSRGLALNNVMSGIGENSFTKEGLEQLIAETQQPDSPAFSLEIISKNSKYNMRLWTQSSDDVSLFSKIISDIKSGSVHLCRNAPAVKNNDDIFKPYSHDTSDQSLEDVENTANAYLKQYHDEIEKAGSPDDKLMAIVKLIQSLHQFHLFPDGNGRTFCFFLLNRLLLDEGLPPTIIQDPGWFTGWSREELVAEVKKGQLRFQFLCSPLETPLTDAIKQKINLTTEEENQLFVSSKKQIEYEQLFHKAVLANNKEEQRAILENLPFHERVYFVEQQQKNCRGEQQKVAQEWLERFRILQACGFDNDPSLYCAVMKSDSLKASKELLSLLHSSNFSKDLHWRQVVTSMIETGYKESKQALVNAMNTAIQLQKQPWFDTKKYTAMLLRSPEYATFTKIHESYFKKGHGGVFWLERSSALLKEYLYEAPASANALLAIASHFASTEQRCRRYISLFENQDPLKSELSLCCNSSNGHLEYKIKYENAVKTIDLEERLLQRITVSQLGEVKELIKKEKSLSLKPVPRSRIITPLMTKTLSFSEKLETINKELPKILRKLAEESTPDSVLQ